ncbi:AAA family ATPase [Devosia sp. Leaf420]|uniref:AAA family ATPase n=1 Tax=Devosia sp. Leaf420 TaxID=1736374 RepID=UPI0007834574|nr:AAA family ATPase [Devosia sp. Leaf420]
MSSLSEMIRNSTVNAGMTAHVMPAVVSSIVILVTAALEEHALSQGVLLPDPWTKDAPPTIIFVPDSSWLAPITVAIDARGGAVHATPSREKSEVASDLDVLVRIEDGASVWVAASSAHVPDLARRAAECVVTVQGLTSAAIARAVGTVTGQEVIIEDADWRGLSLPLIASSIRSGETAEACRDRLRRWSEHTDETADTSEKTEESDQWPVFGSAALWLTETLALFDGLKTCRVPKGLLRHTMLAGQPGCGKSSLVDQLAERAAVPLYRLSVGALFVAGTGHLDSVVRQIVGFFDALRSQNGPAIGIIEEIDAMSTRTGGTDSNGAYWSTVITSILLAIDDLNASGAPVLLVGCTNRPEDVDAAICRPGRIGRLIEVTPPQTIDDVVAVLRVHLGRDLQDAPLRDLSRLWLGESHAQLADRVAAARNRALLAGRTLELADLDPDRTADKTERIGILKKAALHEAAHAVIAHAFGRIVDAMALRLDRAGSVSGFTTLIPRLAGATYDERLDDCCIALAGRAADARFGKRVDDGSASDLIQASHAIALLYLSTGLSETLIALPPDVVTKELTTNLVLQDTVETILQDQMSRADDLVAQHHQTIERLAEVLLERRTLAKAEIAAFLTESKA